MVQVTHQFNFNNSIVKKETAHVHYSCLTLTENPHTVLPSAWWIYLYLSNLFKGNTYRILSK